jgi:hypothetical protein
MDDIRKQFTSPILPVTFISLVCGAEPFPDYVPPITTFPQFDNLKQVHLRFLQHPLALDRCSSHQRNTQHSKRSSLHILKSTVNLFLEIHSCFQHNSVPLQINCVVNADHPWLDVLTSFAWITVSHHPMTLLPALTLLQSNPCLNCGLRSSVHKRRRFCASLSVQLIHKSPNFRQPKEFSFSTSPWVVLSSFNIQTLQHS